MTTDAPPASNTAGASDFDQAHVKTAVDAVLAAARLPLTDEEYARILKNYPFYQSLRAELRIPEARYLSPADIYPA
jgi:hypothetical protein